MKRPRVTRREFLALTSFGAAGACLALNPGLALPMGHGGGGGGGGGMGGGMGGSTTVIDPPPGAPFEEVAVAQKDSEGIYQLQVKEARLRLNGTAVTLLTYNGLYPGPTIRAAQGEILKVRLTNALPKTRATNILGHTRNITNLHTHGLHVTPSGQGDNMMMKAAPGQSLDYVYELLHEEPGHLNFYHPHVHGTVAEQYWGGLAGPLVIEDPPGGPLADLVPHVMMIKDLTITSGVPEPYSSTSQYMRGKEGNLVMVNGQVNPVLAIQPGQVQRWQIVNACTARFLKLALDQHTLWLVGTDGGLLDRPHSRSSILLSPGERIDVLVQADQGAGNFKLLSLPYDRGGSSLQQVTLLTLACSGSGGAQTALPDLFPSINPDAARVVPDLATLPRRQLTLSMMMGKGYINGISYSDMDHAAKISSHLESYEIWEIFNNSGMDHPFHQHVNACQVLSITGGDPDYASLYSTIPAWKDVVIVPRMGSATLLVPVKDYTGMTMFHCHIIEHEDIGMMGVWDIMDHMGM